MARRLTASTSRRKTTKTKSASTSARRLRRSGIKGVPAADTRRMDDLLARYRAAARRKRPGGPAIAAGPAVGAGLKVVTFTSSTFPTVLVVISTHVGAVILTPSASVSLPTGSHEIVWKAEGPPGAHYGVTVTGGTLDIPIAGTIPSSGWNGGPRILTVS
jgi:hypothetical protein